MTTSSWVFNILVKTDTFKFNYTNELLQCQISKDIVLKIDVFTYKSRIDEIRIFMSGTNFFKAKVCKTLPDTVNYLKTLCNLYNNMIIELQEFTDLDREECEKVLFENNWVCKIK